MKRIAHSVAELDVAVLAGGLGTRLSGVLGNLPKILAPVAGRPFLDYLVDWLAAQGASRVLLCLGHQAAAVQDYLREQPPAQLSISTVVEPRPLGTAGAVAFASHLLETDPVLVMNGDTLVNADLQAFLDSHLRSGAPGTVLCAQVENCARFGKVVIGHDDRILRFAEKESAEGPGWTNAGVYLLGSCLLDRIAQIETGSLERDVFEGLPAGTIHAFRAAGGFVDIGTPQSLAQASAQFLSTTRRDP